MTSDEFMNGMCGTTRTIRTRYARDTHVTVVRCMCIISFQVDSITVIYIEINQQYIKQNTRNYQTLCVKLTMQSSNGWIYLKLYTTLKII